MRRHPFAYVTAALLLGSALLASGPARSQSAPAGIETSQSADAFFQSGKDLYKAGKLQEAYEAYRSAWSLKHTHDIAANLANSESQLGKMRDAAEHLAFCVRYFPPSGSKAQLERLKGHFEEARREVGAVFIQVNVEGAEVFVDGASIGRVLPTDEIYLDPGTRTIEVKLKGYEPAKQVVKVAKGPTQTVTLSLAAVAPPPVASAIASAAPAVTTGASAGPPPVPSGIAPRASATSAGPSPILIVASSVLAAGGLAAGIGFTVAANGKSGDADALEAKVPGRSACAGAPGVALPVDCKTLRSTVSEQSMMRNAAFVSFAAGGAFALVAVGLGVWRLKTPTTTGVLHVSPVVGTREGGVVLGGAW